MRLRNNCRFALIPRPDRRASAQSGFTLIEILVALAIITILAGIFSVVAVRARGKARTVTCLNHLRQLGLDPGARERPGISVCPEDGPYGVNKWATSERSVSDSSRTVRMYDSVSGGIGDESDVAQRHQGGACYLFWDGHVEWRKDIPSFEPQ